jgi:formate dehydrogenase major subunit
MVDQQSVASSSSDRSLRRSFLRNLFVREHGPQPFSPITVRRAPRTEGARAVHGVCPYCAVGCSQLIYVKDGQIVDIEGDPASPINRGTLCPKGSATYQMVVNPLRITRCLYRRPFSDHWETVSLDWAMDRIARLIKQVRDETFLDALPDGRVVGHTTAMAALGGATLEVEENYLIKKLLTLGLGIVSVENQARI